MFFCSQSLTFFKKKNRLPSLKPNLSIMSNMMRRKARRVRSHTVEDLWKLPMELELEPIPIRRNATDVVIHTRRNTWNTAKPSLLRVDLATKLDIMLNVVRNQGTFQRRVPRESMYLRKLPLPPSISTKQDKDYQ